MVATYKPIRAVADSRARRFAFPAPRRCMSTRSRIGASPLSIRSARCCRRPEQDDRRLDLLVQRSDRFQILRRDQDGDLPARLVSVHRRHRQPRIHAADRTGTRRRSCAKKRAKRRRCSRLTASRNVERTRQAWVKNGGEDITLPPAEAEAYLKDVTSVIASHGDQCRDEGGLRGNARGRQEISLAAAQRR